MSRRDIFALERRRAAQHAARVTAAAVEQDGTLRRFADVINRLPDASAEFVPQIQSTSFVSVTAYTGRHVIVGPYGVDEWNNAADFESGAPPVNSIRWADL